MPSISRYLLFSETLNYEEGSRIISWKFGILYFYYGEMVGVLIYFYYSRDLN